MIPRAHAQSRQAADNVGHDIVDVEVSIVGKEALRKLGADAEEEGADEEGQVESPPAVGVDDPVEDDGEEEEGARMQDLVVDILAELELCQAGVACEGEEEQEDACASRLASTSMGTG